MNILITGGTGFIGHHLGKKLVTKGHKIYVLTRNKNQTLPFQGVLVDWNDLASERVHKEIDSVVNLAGETIIQLWTKNAKNKILQSRLNYTRELVKIFKDANLKSFISASAVGFYGDRKEEVLTERSSHGEGFLAEVCMQWEKEALKIKEGSNIRVCIMRTALVLGNDGGALKFMAPVFKLGLGAKLGKGEMWTSWIHIDDLVDMYVWLVENEKAQGVYNGASPRPVRNKEFSQNLAKRFNRKSFLTAPKFVISKLLGEMSQMLLISQRVEPTRALDEGFVFQHPSLPEALKTLRI